MNPNELNMWKSLVFIIFIFCLMKINAEIHELSFALQLLVYMLIFVLGHKLILYEYFPTYTDSIKKIQLNENILDYIG